MVQTVALSMQGIPAVYLHSLTATPNDLLGVERSGRTRSINRRKWDRGELETRLAGPDTDTARVFYEYRRRIRLRRLEPAFHPDAAQQILDIGDDLFALRRTVRGGGRSLVAIFNFTPFGKAVALERLLCDPARRHLDLLDENAAARVATCVDLAPYQSRWLVEDL